MRDRSRVVIGGLLSVTCTILFAQFVSGYVYPGPREKVEGLGVWSWVFFGVSACLFVLGFACLKKRRPILGDAVAGLSILVGSFLTIVGLVKIPSGTLSISQSSSGIVATRYVLNDPIMAPIGIGLIMIGAAVIVVSKRRRHIRLVPPPLPPS